MSARYHIDAIAAFVGKEIGTSDWLLVDQARVDAFAAATLDPNPLHTDPEAAKAGPFGRTVAHGFLTLSLLSHFAYDVKQAPEGLVDGVNLGFERVRFMAPVPIGSRIRNRMVLSAATERSAGRWMLETQNTVEIEGGPKPALVAQWLTLYRRA